MPTCSRLCGCPLHGLLVPFLCFPVAVPASSEVGKAFPGVRPLGRLLASVVLCISPIAYQGLGGPRVLDTQYHYQLPGRASRSR